MLIATAGHVDHGKTSLIQALTGVDTDRLPEEKNRGLTIDLGFAYKPLSADGPMVGFVDVPGHERFIHNMLAGVAAIDLALLIVAADDGPMPQTAEHLAILDLLGITRGVVVVTKTDRVEPARVDEVADAARALIAGTGLDRAPVFPVAALKGEGIEDLRGHLDHAARDHAARASGGQFRLAVDRCFTVEGAGVVVTGTVFAGRVAIGDTVRVSPIGIEARVRGLRALNQAADVGVAGQRCALNLAGADIRKDQIHRGDWIVAPPAHLPLRRFDAMVRVLPGETRALAHWTPVHLHLGAADVTGRVALLGRDSLAPGEEGLAQLVLDGPVLAVHGDRFILRDQSAQRTVGGGAVVDIHPPTRGRARPDRLAELAAHALPDAATALDGLLDGAVRGVRLDRFQRARNLTDGEAQALFDGRDMVLVDGADGAIGLRPARLEAVAAQVLAALAEWHAKEPDSLGPTVDQLRRRANLPADLVRHLADSLRDDGRVARNGVSLHLPTHKAQLAGADARRWDAIWPLLEEAEMRPPIFREIAAELSLDPEEVRRLMGRAARVGLVLPVAPNRYFPPAAVRELAELAERLAAEAPFDAARFRDATGIGRNLTIELLEYFDRVGLTRREGSVRVIVRPAADIFVLG
ncbi:MAG: selenocysteine-specific translation elongation factor [Alphaproteobacteria bacterium]